MAKPTALDELFVHQIPQLLPQVVTHHPHWRESYFYDIHDPSGEGYRLLGDAVIALDPLNASTAARLVSPLGLWRRQAPPLAAMMRRELERVLATPNLSKGTFEKASKGLA